MSSWQVGLPHTHTHTRVLILIPSIDVIHQDQYAPYDAARIELSKNPGTDVKYVSLQPGHADTDERVCNGRVLMCPYMCVCQADDVLRRDGPQLLQDGGRHARHAIRRQLPHTRKVSIAHPPVTLTCASVLCVCVCVCVSFLSAIAGVWMRTSVVRRTYSFWSASRSCACSFTHTPTSSDRHTDTQMDRQTDRETERRRAH